MNKMKKILSAACALAMAASYAVIPASAAEYTPIVSGDTVLNEWKFDFGATGSTPEDGYTLVTPDDNFVENGSTYGFLGTGEDDYKLSDRYDGWATQKGQVIELAAGGGSGLADGIGVVGAGGTDENEGADMYGNQADIYYPTRFALKVTDDTYYRVTATVTTLDPTKSATASLYTERKHPIYKDTTIAAGETKTVTFSVRVTPIYYQKSDPTGAIADEMLTVGVLGENTALASLEIQQVETIPTIWVLGDSTVTDGNTTLPFFDLQNYTGVGTGLTLYVPRDMAVVNEGEGGLAANDSLHFNMVTSRIKAGDYMYVEYGHNHKSDGATGYVSYLDKYYEACNSVGATLIVVSPIERINTFSDGAYQHSLQDFATAGEEYVAAKVAEGATDIAYVDLNTYSLDFYNKIVTDNGGDSSAIKYYFQTAQGGATDTTHPNDLGAENLAYEFIKAAQANTDATQAAALADILNDLTDETPNLLAEEIAAGGLGGSAWPTYIVPSDNAYPVVINDIQFDENGYATYAKVTVQDAVISLSTYGIIVITVYDENGTEKGKIYAEDQVDNSTGKGTQEIYNFTKDVTLGETDTYTAVVLQADDTESGLQVTDGGTVYSAVYTPTDIDHYILLNEDGDGYEDFDYYGATYDGASDSLTSYNNWVSAGSAGYTLYLNASGDENYVEIASDGAKGSSANQGSFYLARPLDENIDGVGGKYLIQADVQLVSGGGMTFNLNTAWSASNVNAIDATTLFTIATNGVVTVDDTEVGTVSATGFTTIKYVLDTDLGTATVTVGGDDPVTVNLDTYQTIDADASFPVYTHFMFGGSKVAFDNKVANLVVAKLKDEKLPEYTLTARTNNEDYGTITIEAAEDTADEEAAVSVQSDDATIATRYAVTLEYNDGNAVVTAGKAGTYTLIEAAYADNGSLTSAKLTDLTFDAAGTQTVAVAAGSKVMLWDGADTMVPVAEAITAEASATEEPTETPTEEPTETPTPNPNDKTLTSEINTVVTASAYANDGYVFEGWVDADGTKVSTDAVYSFRLREDTDLTAQFAEQGGIEDITSFSVTADDTFVPVGAEQTVQFALENVFDASGNPVEYSDSNVTWSVDDSALTITGGTLTIPASYDIGDDVEKSVTVSATINNITKTCAITVHSYDYTEDFTEVSDSTWGFSGVGGATVTDGYLSLLANSSANTVGTVTKTLDSEIAAASKVVVKFDWQSLVESGKGRHSNFILADADGNPIFALRGAGSAGLYYSTTLPSNDDADTFVSFSSFNQNWYTVTLTIDFTAGTMSGTIVNTSTGAAVATISETAIPNNAANLGTLSAINTYSLAPMAIDNVNIKLY